MAAGEPREDFLRAEIARWRRYLSEGVDPEVARIFLRDIATAEAELGILKKQRDKP